MTQWGPGQDSGEKYLKPLQSPIHIVLGHNQCHHDHYKSAGRQKLHTRLKSNFNLFGHIIFYGTIKLTTKESMSGQSVAFCPVPVACGQGLTGSNGCKKAIYVPNGLFVGNWLENVFSLKCSSVCWLKIFIDHA